jgi:murein DD-endopeptidase MepM/ murein hydrolase activator NlpD
LLTSVTLASAFLHLYLSRNQSGDDTLEASLVPIPSLSHTLKKAAPEPTVMKVPIEKNQTFSALMLGVGFDSQTVQDVLDGAKSVYNLNQIHAGKSVVLTAGTGNAFASLEYSIDPLKTLVVRKEENGIKAEIHEHQVETRNEELGGIISSSLYSTINRLGGDDQLVMDFADIYEWDVDFFKDLQAGDSFRILYERNYVKGEPLGTGRILAAELINKGRTYTALGYQSEKGWAYFSPDGKAMRRAFLAAPLKFSRISSGFSAHRYHPILHQYRAHYGIDYAAPSGTPVRAIGNGTVLSAGRAGGAGNMVKLQHNKEITTIYCHLSGFAKGIKKGASVSQGQVIGYVGATGLATGPHLDFRFFKNGKYVNFLSIRGTQDAPLSSNEVAAFQNATRNIASQLASVELRKPMPDMAYLSPSQLQLSAGTY